MQLVRFIAGAVFLTAGLLACIVGVIGVFKFRYAANRMHAAAINDTLGISLCMIGLAILAPDIASALKMLLVVVFFWISAPVASHLLCRLEIETNEERDRYMELHVIEGTEAAGDPLQEMEAEGPENADGTELPKDAGETAEDNVRTETVGSEKGERI